MEWHPRLRARWYYPSMVDTFVTDSGTLPSVRRADEINQAECALCGATHQRRNPLAKTPCCQNWICDDARSYGASCFRSHMSKSQCGVHHTEGHPGSSRTCQTCFTDHGPVKDAALIRASCSATIVPPTLDCMPRDVVSECSECGDSIISCLEKYVIVEDKIVCHFCKRSEEPSQTRKKPRRSR
eukprot:Rmarinus@m.24445